MSEEIEKDKLYNEILSSFNIVYESTGRFTSEGDWPEYLGIKLKINKSELSNSSIDFIKDLFQKVEENRERATVKYLDSLGYSNKRMYYPKDDKISIKQNLDFMVIEFPKFLLEDIRLVDNDYNKFVKEQLSNLNERLKEKKAEGNIFLKFIDFSKLFAGKENKEEFFKKNKMEFQIFLNKIFQIDLNYGLDDYFKEDNVIIVRKKLK